MTKALGSVYTYVADSVHVIAQALSAMGLQLSMTDEAKASYSSLG